MRPSGRYFRINLETNLTPEELIAIIPELGVQSGLRIEQTNSPTLHLKIGDMSMDTTKTDNSRRVEVGNIDHSTVGSVGSARDIDIYTAHLDKSGMDEDTKREFLKARRILDACELPAEDKADVEDNLNKLIKVFEKDNANPEPGRVSRYLGRIKEIASPVAAALSIAASITKLSHP